MNHDQPMSPGAALLKAMENMDPSMLDDPCAGFVIVRTPYPTQFHHRDMMRGSKGLQERIAEQRPRP